MIFMGIIFLMSIASACAMEIKPLTAIAPTIESAPATLPFYSLLTKPQPEDGILAFLKTTPATLTRTQKCCAISALSCAIVATLYLLKLGFLPPS